MGKLPLRRQRFYGPTRLLSSLNLNTASKNGFHCCTVASIESAVCSDLKLSARGIIEYRASVRSVKHSSVVFIYYIYGCGTPKNNENAHLSLLATLGVDV